MNNYYTLIYLIREWKFKLRDYRFSEAVSYRKHTLDLYFSSGPDPVRFVFCTDPRRTALFIDRYQEPRRGNAATFFEELAGQSLTGIELARHDRYIRFRFEGGMDLTFLLYGNGANVFLSDGNEILESFKQTERWSGESVPEPVPARGSDPRIGDSDYRAILSVNPLLPREILKNWLRNDPEIRNNPTSRPESASGSTPEAVKVHATKLAEELTGLLESASEPHFCEEYGFAMIPPGQLGCREPRIFESVNDAVAYAFYQSRRETEFLSRKAQLLARMHQAAEKLTRSLGELDRLPDAGTRQAELEQIGHLLMSNPNIHAEGDIAELPDYFNEGRLRRVSVDPALTMTENATRYYEKAKSVQKAQEAAERRRGEIQEKLSRLEELMLELGAVSHAGELQKWLKKNETGLGRFGYASDGQQQSRSFFREFEVEGYTVLVGKSAQGNDELLRFAHKEDVWLHARGASGSHVLIRMNGNRADPPRPVLEKTASIAAFFSKLKGSSLVPVIFTRRKYVRKPKGATAGLARVEKEQVLLVEPGLPVPFNSDE